MRSNKLIVILLSLSSVAFATDHCGNDPTKPDPVPFKCNGVARDANANFLGIAVVQGDCYSRNDCSFYDRAAAIVDAAPMHGRHGHGSYGWTAYREWNVPAGFPKDFMVTITVVKGISVFQNGNRLTANSIGQYKINFTDGHVIFTPTDVKGAYYSPEVPSGLPTDDEMKGETRADGGRYAPGRKGVEEPKPTCVSPKCSPDAVPYSRITTDAAGDHCYGRKGAEISCNDLPWYTEGPTLKHPE